MYFWRSKFFMSLVNLEGVWYLFVVIVAIMYDASWSLTDGRGTTLE